MGFRSQPRTRFQIDAAVKHWVEQFGGTDVADANAGYLGPWVNIGESDPEGWWRNWDVNMQGSYHVAHFALPYLINSAKTYSSKGRIGNFDTKLRRSIALNNYCWLVIK